ncbi:hypothetical protein FA95DRAFT_182582 [Auriscalpium vulgare]|uniref:Uncharacterized protein n=1 Tax=Auriscalpium vulgare TaxID=40419 RepID=A0ACB8RMR2_9AGAM|nr:hypothetical protein FA95DRAFT_182582 [Auriscalpium vulgare]
MTSAKFTCPYGSLPSTDAPFPRLSALHDLSTTFSSNMKAASSQIDAKIACKMADTLDASKSAQVAVTGGLQQHPEQLRARAHAISQQADAIRGAASKIPKNHAAIKISLRRTSWKMYDEADELSRLADRMARFLARASSAMAKTHGAVEIADAKCRSRVRRFHEEICDSLARRDALEGDALSALLPHPSLASAPQTPRAARSPLFLPGSNSPKRSSLHTLQNQDPLPPLDVSDDSRCPSPTGSSALFADVTPPLSASVPHAHSRSAGPSTSNEVPGADTLHRSHHTKFSSNFPRETSPSRLQLRPEYWETMGAERGPGSVSAVAARQSPPKPTRREVARSRVRARNSGKSQPMRHFRSAKPVVLNALRSHLPQKRMPPSKSSPNQTRPKWRIVRSGQTQY